MLNCPNLSIPADIMQHVVQVESSNNPFAIGVVGARLLRQPKNLEEAVVTAKMLQAKGYNFSYGLAQVNRFNLSKYDLTSHEKAFDVCSNLQAGSKILRDCYERSGRSWEKSFSCYYSGNFVTGFKHGYVQKVMESIKKSKNSTPPQAIPVIPRNKPLTNASPENRKGEASKEVSPPQPDTNKSTDSAFVF